MKGLSKQHKKYRCIDVFWPFFQSKEETQLVRGKKKNLIDEKASVRMKYFDICVLFCVRTTTLEATSFFVDLFLHFSVYWKLFFSNYLDTDVRKFGLAETFLLLKLTFNIKNTWKNVLNLHAMVLPDHKRVSVVWLHIRFVLFTFFMD